jgi:hypothetical protein
MKYFERHVMIEILLIEIDVVCYVKKKKMIIMVDDDDELVEMVF